MNRVEDVVKKPRPTRRELDEALAAARRLTAAGFAGNWVPSVERKAWSISRRVRFWNRVLGAIGLRWGG
jgi:hypothetical protein